LARRGLRIYYASDVHGSERCFRKFLGAAKFYDAQVLILGGDITGKVMIPIVEMGRGRYQALFRERLREFGSDELEAFENNVRFDGFYPYRCSLEEYTRLRDDEKFRETVFSSVMVDQIRSWVELATERLAATDIRCYIMPGNDDGFVIDDFLDSEVVKNPDGRVLRLGDIQILSCSWANPTPWDSPREEPDDTLLKRLERLADGLTQGVTSIFNLHCPPYGTTLDIAPKLTADLQVVVRGGQPVLVHVGSSAVRSFVERHRPLLSLHGHIHESRAVEKIGPTTCVNPGSRYSEGVLDGVIVEINENKLKQCQLVAG
jgi:uncharacterized protein